MDRFRPQRCELMRSFVVSLLSVIAYASARSITFARHVPLDFMQSVYSHLHQQRFAVIERGDAKRRALAVRDFTFALQGGRWMGRRYDIEPIRQAIIEKEIPASIPQLEGEAHCP